MTTLKELLHNKEIVLTIGLDEKDGSVILIDKYSNTISLGSNGISLISNTDINISAKGKINIEGLNVIIDANAGLIAKGNESAEFSSSIGTTIKGAIVNIN